MDALARIAPGLLHDLKVPLNTIRINAELIRRAAARVGESEAAERLVRAADAAEQGVLRLKEMLEALFDVIDTRPRPSEPRELGAALRRAALLAGPEARRRRIDLRIETLPDLPAPEVDRRRLVAAVLHLVVDAMERSSAGGKLLVRARADDGETRIEVEDLAGALGAGGEGDPGRPTLVAARAAAAAFGGRVEEVKAGRSDHPAGLVLRLAQAAAGADEPGGAVAAGDGKVTTEACRGSDS
jgi:hypothetical protein